MIETKCMCGRVWLANDDSGRPTAICPDCAYSKRQGDDLERQRQRQEKLLADDAASRKRAVAVARATGLTFRPVEKRAG